MSGRTAASPVPKATSLCARRLRCRGACARALRKARSPPETAMWRAVPRDGAENTGRVQALRRLHLVPKRDRRAVLTTRAGPGLSAEGVQDKLVPRSVLGKRSGAS